MDTLTTTVETIPGTFSKKVFRELLDTAASQLGIDRTKFDARLTWKTGKVVFWERGSRPRPSQPGIITHLPGNRS